MSGIEELRQRVLDAEERFGRFNEQHAKYSGRLIDLMNAVEERVRDQQGEIETQKAKIDGQGAAIARQAEEIEKFKAPVARKAEENEQLRTMLHSLLGAIEAGSRDVLAEVMVQLDSMVSVLMDNGAHEAVAEIEEPVAEEPAEVAAEIEDPAAEEPAVQAGPVAAEGAIATGDILETPEMAEDSAEDPMAASDAPAPEAVAEESVEPVAEEPDSEEPVEPVAEAEEPAAEEPAAEDVAEPAAEVAESVAPGSLDEIMERVSKLVQETEAAIAAPEPCAAEPAEAPEGPAEETAEEPAQQASAAGS